MRVWRVHVTVSRPLDLSILTFATAERVAETVKTFFGPGDPACPTAGAERADTAGKDAVDHTAHCLLAAAFNCPRMAFD